MITRADITIILIVNNIAVVFRSIAFVIVFIFSPFVLFKLRYYTFLNLKKNKILKVFNTRLFLFVKWHYNLIKLKEK